MTAGIDAAGERVKAPLPPNEAARIHALHHYAILDTTEERAPDDIAKLASFICESPILISNAARFSQAGVSTTRSSGGGSAFFFELPGMTNAAGAG